jgi:DNA-directed RNA polymerase subunit N
MVLLPTDWENARFSMGLLNTNEKMRKLRSRDSNSIYIDTFRMEFPVRCFCCGKVIGDKCEKYKKHVIDGDENADRYLDKLGLRRQCCRVRFLTFPWTLRDDLYLYDGTKKTSDGRLS